MKKIGILLLSAAFLTSSCKKKEYQILSPVGAPSLAFYNRIDSLKTNANPANIVSMMISGEAEFIVMDALTGLKQVALGVDYQLAAFITFGNYYLLAKNNEETAETLSANLKNGSIFSFGNNQNPTLVFNSVYQADNINYSTTGVAGTREVICSGVYGSKNIDYIFTAEPILTSALNDNNCRSDYKIFNFQEAFAKKHQGAVIPQAGLFVKKNYNPKKILNSLKQEITDGIANPNLIIDKVKTVNASEIFGIDASLLEKVLINNRIGLGYKNANIDELRSFYSLINVEITLDQDYFYE